ncbi:DUF421 domain-containing protein [Maledivibacter halophilus]|uniref:Uncharacterized membrane protein YcaP, DUF421 family n=1 Tax=Maledivibacter halophilus TaxID=36842 RepID=A0A1T5M0B6_9FIRM|nr:DUF421 domain-containing protein [Maledivibacter halophilus]SKC81662.1 Uncharacterized membrane protein YcaP, DUF421 family [Maledivibacter halophilus]
MELEFIGKLTLQLILGFFSLLIITKILGKTQISQVTPFDFISSLVLGELLGNVVYDKEIHIFVFLYAIFMWTFLIYIIEVITQKFRRTRSFFEGNPSILIRNGQIDFHQLKKEMLDINELMSLLRGRDIFSIREVQYAILEPNGSLSILKKSKYDTPTKEELNIVNKEVYLPVAFILDKEIIWENLNACGFDESWLRKELEASGIKDINEIFFAEWKYDEGLHIVPFREKK